MYHYTIIDIWHQQKIITQEHRDQQCPIFKSSCRFMTEPHRPLTIKHYCIRFPCGENSLFLISHTCVILLRETSCHSRTRAIPVPQSPSLCRTPARNGAVLSLSLPIMLYALKPPSVYLGRPYWIVLSLVIIAGRCLPAATYPNSPLLSHSPWDNQFPRVRTLSLSNLSCAH